MTTANQAQSRPHKRGPVRHTGPFLPLPPSRAISAALDRAVWERDRGVCKECGLDLEAVRALLDGYYASAIIETHHDANRAMAITRCYARAMWLENAEAYPHRLWDAITSCPSLRAARRSSRTLRRSAQPATPRKPKS